MPQITPINLPPQMIPSMHHLVRHNILQMISIPNLIRTNPNTMIRTKPASPPQILLRPIRIIYHPRRTPRTLNLIRNILTIQIPDFLRHESDYGRVVEQVIAVFFAAFAVFGFFGDHEVFGEEVFAVFCYFLGEDVFVGRVARVRIVAGSFEDVRF